MEKRKTNATKGLIRLALNHAFLAGFIGLLQLCEKCCGKFSTMRKHRF
jgi:hypothetical protein